MADQNFTISAGFFDSQNSDRTYRAEDMNRPYSRVVGDGVFASQQGTPNSDFLVSATTGMVIAVAPGQGIAGGKWIQNTGTQNITVPNNTGLTTRYDSVIMQMNVTDLVRAGRIVYRTGGTTPPTLVRSGGVTEYRLANIRVVSATTSISATDITDTRGSEDCPWVAGLIDQLDTSTIYNQYRAGYDAFYRQETERFAEFMETLTEQLEVNTFINHFENSVTIRSAVSTVDIGITSFNRMTDVLMVYVNGWRAIENTDYTLDSLTPSVTFASPLEAGNKVNFICLHGMVGADLASAAGDISTINAKIASMSIGAGQTLNLSGNWYVGTMETTSVAHLQIPTSSPILANYFNTVGDVTAVTRQGGNYTHGSSSGSPQVWTVSRRIVGKGGIFLTLTRTASITNAVANDLVSFQFGTLKLTFANV